MMCKLYLILLLLSISLLAQSTLPFSLEVKEVAISGEIPALQSFSLAEYQGEWLIVGGLTDGVHGDGKKIFATGRFPQSNFNRKIWVVAPESGKVWSSDVPEHLQASLVVANAQYYQIAPETLCIVGGYGWGNQQTPDTLGTFTWIDVPKLISAIKNHSDISSCFRQIDDHRLRVTGGELKYLNGEFFLVVGQEFIGEYLNGEKQYYTLEIRKFSVDSRIQKIENYQAIGEDSIYVRPAEKVRTLANPKRFTHDLNKVLPKEILQTLKAHGTSLDQAIAEGKDRRSHLRRRDLNVTEAIFPDGSHGFVLYGGGFEFSFPFFTMHKNPIFFSPHKIFAKNSCHAMLDLGFEQSMSHYTCAHMLLYDPQKSAMHTILYGGISTHVYDPKARETVRDRLLPYVNNITIQTLMGSKSSETWQSQETVMEEETTPIIFGEGEFFGTNAKFILNQQGKMARFPGTYEILDISRLQKMKRDTTIGYIYGGIRALKQNFGETQASNKIFAVTVKFQK